MPTERLYAADRAAAARERARPFVSGCFEGYTEMASAVDLDGVVIATPPRTHRDLAVAALEADLGVLCEKPIALTVDDGEVIVAAAGRSRRPLLVGFCHRFQPQVRKLRDLLGTIGRPALIDLAFTHGLTEEGREWITDPRLAGGGVLFDSGSHAIDLFRYLVGDIDEACGLSVGSRAGVEDRCIVTVRAGDVLGSVRLSWNSPPWYGLVEVVGSLGRLRVEYEGDLASLRCRLGESDWRSVRTSRESRFVSQMRHFLACLRGHEGPLATARDGLEATRAIVGIYAGGYHRPS